MILFSLFILPYHTLSHLIEAFHSSFYCFWSCDWYGGIPMRGLTMWPCFIPFIYLFLIWHSAYLLGVILAMEIFLFENDNNNNNKNQSLTEGNWSLTEFSPGGYSTSELRRHPDHTTTHLRWTYHLEILLSTQNAFINNWSFPFTQTLMVIKSVQSSTNTHPRIIICNPERANQSIYLHLCISHVSIHPYSKPLSQ